jgi:diguanylate cyclase (GGDEF)-like protein
VPDPGNARRPAAVRWARTLGRQSLRTTVLVGLLGLILLTAAGAAVIYRAITVATGTGERIARTIEIRAAGTELADAVTDAEDAERGYLLTGNERFLDPYTDAVTSVPRSASRIIGLLDDRAQIERVQGLAALFTRWRDGVAQPEIAARRAAPSGYAAAGTAAAAEALRLRSAVAAYAAVPSGENLRLVRAQAGALRRELAAMLRMTPPSLVTPDWAASTRLLDTLANAPRSAPPSSLLAPAAQLDAIVRRHAMAAAAAESTVMTMIARRSAETFGDSVRRQYAAFAAASNARLAADIARGRAATQVAKAVAVAIPLVVVLLLLAGLYYARSTTREIGVIIDASRGLAEGDLTRRVPVQRSDEIGQLGGAFNDMAQQIATRDHQAALLRHMSELLEASGSVPEALTVVSRYTDELFPGTFGGVYLLRASRDVMEMGTSWGEDRLHPLPPVFPAGDCWALRHGHLHTAGGGRGGVMCAHTASPPPAATLCLPLTAQGDTVGVLVMAAAQAPANGDPASAGRDFGAAAAALVRSIGDRAGLAVANLKLRDTLRSQSIRDPLTNVYNRRYLEETLEREIRRAERTQHPLGLIMFDIDGFKQFNDNFGHGAGDAYLRELGALLRERFRREDVVCRYGGDEFVVVLPEASLEATQLRAAALGDAVERLVVTYHTEPLGTATLSLGIAGFPQHGRTGEVLLRAADAALYRAKQMGRARSEVATP